MAKESKEKQPALTWYAAPSGTNGKYEIVGFFGSADRTKIAGIPVEVHDRSTSSGNPVAAGASDGNGKFQLAIHEFSGKKTFAVLALGTPLEPKTFELEGSKRKTASSLAPLPADLADTWNPFKLIWEGFWRERGKEPPPLPAANIGTMLKNLRGGIRKHTQKVGKKVMAPALITLYWIIAVLSGINPLWFLTYGKAWLLIIPVLLFMWFIGVREAFLNLGRYAAHENRWILPLWIIWFGSIARCLQIYVGFYPPVKLDLYWIKTQLQMNYPTAAFLDFGWWLPLALLLPFVVAGYTRWALRDDWEGYKERAGERGRNTLAWITGAGQPQQPGAAGAPLLARHYFLGEIFLGLIPEIIHDIRS